MQKPFYSIQLNKPEEPEILVYGVIGQDQSNEGNTAKKFVKDFKDLEESADKIHIRINSPGGSVWEGMPICNAMRASKKEVHTYVDGIAYSMGAMMLESGHVRHAANKQTSIMTHNVSGNVYGNAKVLLESAKNMEMHDTFFINMLAERTGKSVDFVKTNWLNYQDNYFTAEAALSAGLIDVIDHYQAKNIPKNLTSMNYHQAMAYYQARHDEPQTFLAKGIHFIKNNITNEPMNKFKKLVTIGFSAEDEKPIEVEKAESEIEALKQENEALKAEIEALKKENEALKAGSDDLKAQLNEVSTPPSAPVAPADVIYNSSSRPSFETSFDREVKALFRNR